MPDIQSDPNVLRDRPKPASVPEADKPTRGDTWFAAWRTASDDIAYVQQQRRDAAYAELVRKIKERRDIGIEGFFAFQNPKGLIPVYGIFADDFDSEAIWKAVEQERSRDPKAFSDLPQTQEEFERQIARRERHTERNPLFGSGGHTRSEDQKVLAKSDHWMTALGASLVSQVQDPINLGTAPIGAASKNLGQAIYRGFVVNAAIETAQLPLLNAQREKMGEELTWTEGALSVGLAGGLGGLLSGGGHMLAKNWDAIKAAPKAVQEKLWSSLLESSPQLRSKIGSDIDWDALDKVLPEIVGDLGQSRDLPPEVVAAKAMLDRNARFAVANPFSDDAIGRKVYHDGLSLAMREIMDNTPIVAPRAFTPRAGRADLRLGTAIASRTVPGEPRAIVKSKIMRAESGGKVDARNPRGSATGLYQFISSTWLRLYKNRYGSRGLSDAQILEKRLDPRIQEQLMNDSLDIYDRSLKAAGLTPSAGNLYLAHFFGPTKAVELLKADPNAALASKVSSRVMRDNPFLRGMRVSDVVNWTRNKMGGAGPSVPVRGGAPVKREIVLPNSRLSSGYGPRKAPVKGASTNHKGLDFAAPAGTPIRPAEGGVVTRNFWDKGGGWVVSVRHADGTESSYMHMQKKSPIAVGTQVSKDTVIGGVGTTGRSSGNHLHFGVKNKPGGTWIDPNEWLEGQGAASAAGDGFEGRSAADQLQDEIDRLRDERRDVFGEIADEAAAARNGGADAFDMRQTEEAALDVPERKSPLAESEEWSEAVNDIMPQMRALVGKRGANLNNRDGLANRFGVDRQDVDYAIERLVGDGTLRLTAKGKVIRPRVGGARQPKDVIGILAARGGIRDTEGHNLRNSGSFNHFEPGVGPLLRPNGRSIEEVGEMLWDWGVFGPTNVTPRPTERVVMDWINDTIRNKRKIDPETGQPIAVANEDWQSRGYASEEDFRQQRDIADQAAQGVLGRKLTDEEFAGVEALENEPGYVPFYSDAMSPEDMLEARMASSIVDLINREVDDVLDRAYIETEDVDYDLSIETQLARETAPLEKGGAGQIPQPGSARGSEGNAGQGRGAAGSERLDEIPPPLSPEDYVAYSRVDGPAVEAQAASAMHDMRMALERPDPNIADRQRQEAQLRAEAPLRGENATGEAQDGTMGSPLFDAADQPKFRLDDDGDAMSARDILDDLEAEEAMLRSIKDCL